MPVPGFSRHVFQTVRSGPSNLSRVLWRPVRPFYRPVFGSLAAGIAVTLFMLVVLQSLPFFQRDELAAYDFQFARRGDLSAPTNIIFVGVDHDSIDFLNDGSYPLRRRSIADAVRFLHRAGARAIGLDFIFESPKVDDNALAAAMREAGNVVVAQRLGASLTSNYIAAETELVPPVAPLARAAAAIGVANVNQDDDGGLRSVELLQAGPGGKTIGGKLYPTFAAQLASVALHKPLGEILRGLPRTLYVNYVGPQAAGDASQQTLQLASITDVAIGDDSPKLFRDKIVIIGCADIVCNDLWTTPYGQMYGSAVQANILATILNRHAIQPAGTTANNLLLLLVAFATTLAATHFRLAPSLAATILVTVGYAVVAFVLFSGFRIWVHLVTPETTVVLVFAAIMGLRFATEERQRRRTGKKFGQYVKPEIVEILMSAPDEEKALAGARRPITVLFADVRGFTRLSELMEPEDVVSTLDIYLEELTASIQEHDGTLDKYVGDEVMAIWNAPRYQGDHALLAVLAALDMVARTDRINEQLRAGNLPAIRFGIGVNSGDAVVGEMGSTFRKQYDVIGDTVNTGARLCSAAGMGEIIIGQATWELIGDRLVVEETEPLPLKNKREPLRTFRVLGMKPDLHQLPQPAPAPA